MRNELLVLMPAGAGAILGAYALLAPETGVNGTAGAALALFGTLAVCLGAVLGGWLAGGWGTTFRWLTPLGAVLTAVAAWFLMQCIWAVLMAMAFLGTLYLLVRPYPRPVNDEVA